MGGCLRGSRSAVALAALALVGCSAQRIVAVDPFPCGDGGPSGCVGLLDDLIGFWQLDDPAGSSTARDFSLRGNTGMLMGIDPGSAWVAGGPEGRALAPQGKGFVLVPRSTSIDSITTQVTMAAWIYIDGSITDYATAISRQIGTSYGQHYHLSIRSDLKPGLFITALDANNQEVQQFINGPTAIAQQTWVHIAGTYDGTMVRLYLNGAEVQNVALTGPFAMEDNPVILSGNGNSTGPMYTERIPGRLNDVMLYRRALRSDEIASLSNGALIGWSGSQRDAGAGQ
jgi:hypothetical protein